MNSINTFSAVIDLGAITGPLVTVAVQVLLSCKTVIIGAVALFGLKHGAIWCLKTWCGMTDEDFKPERRSRGSRRSDPYEDAEPEDDPNSPEGRRYRQTGEWRRGGGK